MELIFSPITAAVFAGFAVLALVIALRPMRASHALEERLSSYMEKQAATGHEKNFDTQLQGSFADRVILPLLSSLLHAVGRLDPNQNLEMLNRQLNAAGRPGNLGAADFMGIRILAIILFIGLGFVVGRSMTTGNPRMLMLGPLGGAVLGYIMPKNWLSSKMKSRHALIERALPDALDMLTICVEAGLAFESALQRVSQQWKGPLSDEFNRVVSEIRLGVPRPQALRRLAERCDTSDVSSFVAILVQADSMGTSIAQVLRNQSDQIRVLRRQRAEEKANRAPLLVMLPLVGFIFPALFVVLLGPAVPKILEAFGGVGK